MESEEETFNRISQEEKFNNHDYINLNYLADFCKVYHSERLKQLTPSDEDI